ncbi:hypothetical protein GGF46_001681 [Coemansia sp. RSA 552]|nr:hypothetical protein GGF46_001681 [Coemansia sp. RSA 552]
MEVEERDVKDQEESTQDTMAVESSSEEDTSSTQFSVAGAAAAAAMAAAQAPRENALVEYQGGVQALLADSGGVHHYHRPHITMGTPKTLLERMIERRMRVAGGDRAAARTLRRLCAPGTNMRAERWTDQAISTVRITNPRRGVGKSHGERGRKALAAALERQRADEAAQHTVNALGQGDADAILELVRGGAQVNAADAAGRTALHVASTGGNVAGVRLLLHLGACADACDRLGNTPLALAATAARTDVVVALLEAGADPRAGGGGVVSATAMVRSRLRLLRTQIRHARALENIAGPSSSTDNPLLARDRRRHAAAVAHDCVDIIRLLRMYTQRRIVADAADAADAAAYDAARGAAEPSVLAAADASQLDELSAQLTALGLDQQEPKPASPAPPAPDSPTLARTEGSPEDIPRLVAPPAGDLQDSGDPDSQIEDLLDRFALLLGDGN